jgi:hypothetical protein
MISILYAISIIVNFLFEYLTHKLEIYGVKTHIALLFILGFNFYKRWYCLDN